MSTMISRSISAHIVRNLESNIIFLTLKGELNPSDVEDLFREAYRIIDQNGHVFSIIDVTELTLVPAEARRTAYRLMSTMPPYRGSTALFGASTAVRVIFTLVLNGVRLITARDTNEIAFFKDHDAALAWLMERRRVVTSPLHANRRP